MRKILQILTLTFAMFVCTSVIAEPNFNQTQIKNLNLAYNYGKTKGKQHLPSRTGDDIGLIMAAIIWQESSAGINCGNGHAQGAFQNYIPTVKSRMQKQGQSKSNAQIKNELKNFNTSAYWASVELGYWLKVHNGNMQKALASYNAGWATHKGQAYSNSVLRKAEYLKRNNVLEGRK